MKGFFTNSACFGFSKETLLCGVSYTVTGWLNKVKNLRLHSAYIVILFFFFYLRFDCPPVVTNDIQLPSFQGLKSAFQPSELWHPQNSKIYKEWRDFKEKRRRELEIISADESLWQKFVRVFFDYSPARSRLVKSNSVPDRY